MADSLLDIVDENDQVIGQAIRSDIHRQGLLHREIHVWLVTSDNQVIFQKRALDKDVYPGYLDATAGGHVEPGMSYEEAAITELQEETGLIASANSLHFIDKYRSTKQDVKTGLYNDVFRAIYGGVYAGRIDDLAIEKGLALGFIACDFRTIYDPASSLHDNVIPGHTDACRMNIFKSLEDLLLMVPEQDRLTRWREDNVRS